PAEAPTTCSCSPRARAWRCSSPTERGPTIGSGSTSPSRAIAFPRRSPIKARCLRTPNATSPARSWPRQPDGGTRPRASDGSTTRRWARREAEPMLVALNKNAFDGVIDALEPADFNPAHYDLPWAKVLEQYGVLLPGSDVAQAGTIRKRSE